MSKKAREERRAARLEAERAAAAAAARRRRTWRLAGAAGVAAVLVTVGIAFSASSSEKPTVPQPGQAAEIVQGIPERDGVLGDPNAPITITEFVDLQCPVCAQASRETLPEFIDKYVRTGKVKLRARTLSFLGPDSVKAAKFAAGAREQGRLWSFLEMFYASQGQENSGYVTDDFLRDVAAAAGVDADAAFKYADSDEAAAQLVEADDEALRLGVDSTPSFTVTRPGSEEEVVAVGTGDLAAKLDEAVNG
jgi:protein-disulfide isomerase